MAMRSLGGICATLADALTASLQAGYIHVFNAGDYPNFVGGAPQNLAGTGWVAISNYYTNTAFNANHQTNTNPPTDLQQVLAHEADHFTGLGDHIPGDPSSTTHSAQCSGL